MAMASLSEVGPIIQSYPPVAPPDFQMPTSALDFRLAASLEREDSRNVRQSSTKEVDPALIEEVANKLNGIVEAFQREITFSIHKDTRQMVVRVINAKTGELIRQVPPEAILEALARIDKMIGLLVDDKV